MFSPYIFADVISTFIREDCIVHAFIEFTDALCKPQSVVIKTCFGPKSHSLHSCNLRAQNSLGLQLTKLPSNRPRYGYSRIEITSYRAI